MGLCLDLPPTHNPHPKVASQARLYIVRSSCQAQFLVLNVIHYQNTSSFEVILLR